MKKIITSIFILMFYLGCSPSQKDVLFANASDEQIIEWGKQYVIHSIEDSLKEGESYKIMEWILAEKKTVKNIAKNIISTKIEFDKNTH